MATSGYPVILEKLSSIEARISIIEERVGRMDKSLNGNGKPGALEHINCMERELEKHLTDYEADIKKRDKKENRSWSIYLAIITQAIAWIFVLLKTYFPS